VNLTIAGRSEDPGRIDGIELGAGALPQDKIAGVGRAGLVVIAHRHRGERGAGDITLPGPADPAPEALGARGVVGDRIVQRRHAVAMVRGAFVGVVGPGAEDD
jgi:hypothetical protein